MTTKQKRAAGVALFILLAVLLWFFINWGKKPVASTPAPTASVASPTSTVSPTPSPVPSVTPTPSAKATVSPTPKPSPTIEG